MTILKLEDGASLFERTRILVVKTYFKNGWTLSLLNDLVRDAILDLRILRFIERMIPGTVGAFERTPLEPHVLI